MHITYTMSKRETIKTTKKEIVNYWSSRVNEWELSVDFSEAQERCWRCGCKSVLYRCHIIPDSLGGKDDPTNLVLMCNRCHREAPNINDKDFFWDWLKAQKTFLYDTYWTIRGMKEYEDIYKESFMESFQKTNAKNEDFEIYLNKKKNFVTIHFGEGRLNPSTIAGILRSFIKEHEKKKC